MSEDQVKKLLNRLDTAWAAFKESYAGVPDAQLMEPGVIGDWSVKDILAHVTIWEEEALKHLPLIIAGGTPPRYVTYGASPRASINMILAGRALALVRGREYALPADVRDIAHDVLRHRLVLSYEALADNVTSDDILDNVLARIPLPDVVLRERGRHGDGLSAKGRWTM